MKLKIITTQKYIEHEVDWVELQTPSGNIVVQQGHAPVIIELKSGHELEYQVTDGRIESVLIIQGVAHIQRFQVTILLPNDL
jgi:F0F1-type ATP synthase epsilon subunit